uniref:J domain-containing protein n=1 Tax=Globodera rostochiensis TaxID=31243 RepID=A0A914HST5_GLORO
MASPFDFFKKFFVAGKNENMNYYELLGVSEMATSDEIVKAYYERMMAYHPDRNPHGVAMSRLFTKAKETLTDPHKKAIYDQRMYSYATADHHQQGEPMDFFKKFFVADKNENKFCFAGKDENVNYYQLLGVSEKAKTDEINKAYRERMMFYHPDRNAYGDAMARLFMKAKETLTDPHKKAIYDQRMYT